MHHPRGMESVRRRAAGVTDDSREGGNALSMHDGGPSPSGPGPTNKNGQVGNLGSAARDRKEAFPRESPVESTVSYGLVLCLAVAVTVGYTLESVEPALTVREGSPFTQGHVERTRGHVEGLCRLGTRTVGGHANEVAAVDYLLARLAEVERKASPGALVEIAKHTSSGSFNMDFIGGATNVYEDVTNVLCRISSKESPASRENAVLINAHFDSALGSPGAADDVVMVGLMLELASHLAADPSLLSNASVVLIFNGAEETNWQAAHGFITSPNPLRQAGATPLATPSDWRPSLKCVLNLEAIGSGGRELLVRTGRGAGWLSRLFASTVSRPRGNVIAQEVFDSGIFPGQTDFVVFRDDGGIPGVDLVLIENGYGYHSPHDRPDQIPDGDVRRVGTTVFDMAEAMLGAVGRREHRPMGDGNAVFFDVLGLFMVWYPAWAGRVFNGAAAAVALLRVRQSWVSLGDKLVIGAVKRELHSFACGILCPVAFGAIMVVVNPLAFYSNFHLTMLLYSPASLLGSLLSRCRRGWDAETEHQLAHCASLAISAFLLSAVTFAGVMSSYVLLIPLAATLLAGGDKCTPFRVALHYGLCSAPIAYWFQTLNTTLQIFQPVMGRSGMALPPDVFLAAIVGIVTSIALLPVLAPLASLRQPRAGALIVLVWVGVCFRAYGSAYPYTEERPKKLIVQHVSRVLAGQPMDSGLWVNGFDYRRLSDLKNLGVERFAQAQPWPGCEGGVATTGYCDMPWYFPLRDVIRGSWYLDFPPFLPPANAEFSLMLAGSPGGSDGTRRVTLALGGPSHMAVVFRDPGKRIRAWSLAQDVGHNGGRRRSDGHIFVFYSSGGTPVERRREWTFWVDVVGDDKIETLAYTHILNWGSEGSVNVDGCRGTEVLAWLRDSLPADYEPVCWSSSVETRLI